MQDQTLTAMDRLVDIYFINSQPLFPPRPVKDATMKEPSSFIAERNNMMTDCLRRGFDELEDCSPLSLSLSDTSQLDDS